MTDKALTLIETELAEAETLVENAAADVTAAKDRLTQAESNLVAARDRLSRLQQAKAILSGHPAQISERRDEPPAKIRLADRIEMVLLEYGPLSASEVYDRISASGHQTSINTVGNYLSTLKRESHTASEEGKWNLTKSRRRQLEKE